MKTSNILWIVSAVLALVFLVYFTRSNFEVFKLKKISGESIGETELIVASYPTKNNEKATPNVWAKAYYLVDVGSARELAAKNADTKLPIASTTKIATALVVLENYGDRLQDVVTITPKMINVEETTIKLRPGEKITVESLLNGLLIMSGNDAAFSLAGYFGGKDNFVAEMNSKVRQLGAENTQYYDPAGLDDRGYSTASELATIAAYALRNPKFAEIVRTPEKTITSTDGRVLHELKSSNRMLRPGEQLYYAPAIGVKTGFTFEAGHVLISAAEQNGHRILAVVLNTNENTIVASAKESKKLLEWGFANWTWSQ